MDEINRNKNSALSDLSYKSALTVVANLYIRKRTEEGLASDSCQFREDPLIACRGIEPTIAWTWNCEPESIRC